jgi:hypothetical protein
MLKLTLVCIGLTCVTTVAAGEPNWWNPQWQYRTSVTRPTPYRDSTERPVEVAVDFQRLLQRAGSVSPWDPASVRVVQRNTNIEVPAACRTEFNVPQNRQESYLTWYAPARPGQCGSYDIYFNTKDRPVPAGKYAGDRLPPENLLANPGFEDAADGLPAGWQVQPAALVRLGRFAHTSGRQSLAIVVDETTPADIPREATITQKIDVRRFAGQEMVFQCDLLAQRAAYGAPVAIELEQFRADGSAILEHAVEPRWLTIELAQGQLVQSCERGQFSPEAATLTVRVRARCRVTDADTGKSVTGPESYFTVWLDRLVVRPGERWPWPAASHAGFVEGALTSAPLNRGLELTGRRFLALNGASEGTLTRGVADPGPQSVHWGLQAGTLEFWCKPTWNAGDDTEHIFWEGVAYLHRRQSVLRKLGAAGKNQLEFEIADADGVTHAVRGPAPLKAGRWHHIAATWDMLRAHLALFVDGKTIATHGPKPAAWPCSLAAAGGKTKGIGIFERDGRSLPMQAFIGGERRGTAEFSAEAVLDEYRISDIERYAGPFTPSRTEFPVDEHTRALFHFENERDGVHAADDRFVRGHLCVELPLQEESVPLEILSHGKVRRQAVLVQPHAPTSHFEANRAEGRLPVNPPYRQPPDPRYIEFRDRQVERTVTGKDARFTLTVEGDYPPLMRCVTFEPADRSAFATTLLPCWRANNAVVPLGCDSIQATLGAEASDDAEKAFAAFHYALQTAHYYDGCSCETLPTQHRRRLSYTFLKALNIYPFDQCGPLNHMLRKLFLAVGISSNNSSGTHHQFQEAYYQGQWRLFDLSARVFWLNRDNATVVGRRGMEEDPYLKIRQGGEVCAWLRGIPYGASFGTAVRPHSMDFPLRPGERASLCWHNEGRWFEVHGNREPLPLAKIPPIFGNGAIVYQPARGEATALDNAVIEQGNEGDNSLRAQNPEKKATLVYRARCPYIFSDAVVGGSYTASQGGAVRLSLSFDEGKRWSEIWRSPDLRGAISASLREPVTARYAYWLKVELAAGQDAVVHNLKVRSTLVASPLALAGKLSRGENRITLVGAAPAAAIKTTCRWTERSRSELGVAIDGLSFYTEGDELHRNVLVVPPGGEVPVKVTLRGRRLRSEVRLEGLPAGWTCTPARQAVVLASSGQRGTAEFTLRTRGTQPGEIHVITVVIGQGDDPRRVPVQVLVAEAPLVGEAERADEIAGLATVRDAAELSGARGLEFSGNGRLAMDFTGSRGGTYALWLRARWPQDSDTSLSLAIDGAASRTLRITQMIGFSDWTDPREAHTKRFHGEQSDHWGWYRVPDVILRPGKHRLSLSAGKGAWLDALLLLPQDNAIDRAAMNLFQNWNFAPWRNPF